MEPKRKIGPYAWQRFKSRLKVRLLIFGAVLAIFILIRLGLGV